MVYATHFVPENEVKPEPSPREKALADPALPAALKDLSERIIPNKLQDEFRHLVDCGAIDPLQTCAAQPLFSPVSQVMGLPPEEADVWLQILFAHAPAAALEATCPCYGFRNGRFSTDPDFRDTYYGTALETPALAAVLAARTDTPVITVAKIFPQLLDSVVSDRYGNIPEQSLLHQMVDGRELNVPTFDKLEELTGGTDFLASKNARGETMFHRIVSYTSSGEDLNRLDIASWMLQRRPELINDPDRFGWTPLDRLVSRTQGNVDTSMGRLLIVSGARLEKQLAPKFNLQSALDTHSGARLDKPSPRKPGGLTKAL